MSRGDTGSAEDRNRARDEAGADPSTALGMTVAVALGMTDESHPERAQRVEGSARAIHAVFAVHMHQVVSDPPTPNPRTPGRREQFSRSLRLPKDRAHVPHDSAPGR